MNFLESINNILLSNSFNRGLYFVFIALLILIFKNVLADIFLKIINFNKKIDVRKSKNHKVISFLIMITLMYFSTNILELAEGTKFIINRLYRSLIIISIAIIINNIISINLKIFKNLKENKKTNTMMGFLIKIIHAIIYIIASLIIIKEFGYDINAILAGIGVSGVVIAFGAQETFKNFFSSLSLLLDKTFFIGDCIEIDGISGIIEEITFRSVKVRTFDNAVVNIPNNIIVNKNIINWSKMKKRKIKSNIIVKYDITLLKLSKVIDGIKNILLEDENIIKDEIFVNFENFDEYGYKIMISCYTTIFKYNEYLDVKEKVNYKIMALLKKEKVDLAYPTQMVYIDKK